jgi:hypothetical protein
VLPLHQPPTKKRPCCGAFDVACYGTLLQLQNALKKIFLRFTNHDWAHYICHNDLTIHNRIASCKGLNKKESLSSLILLLANLANLW